MADKCTEPSALCHVQDTVLGYYPNLGSGIFFAIAFGICLIAAVSIGVWKRTWTYTAAITIGLVLETAGYVGRILLHHNPFNENAFELQICAIILAPTFICVSIYLTLKHVALHLAPETSRFDPKWYPRIFLPADLSCLIVQAIGGGIAAAAGHDKPKLQQDGNRAIIAGVVLQVLVLFMFGILGTDYFVRVRRRFRDGGANVLPQQRALYNDKKFRMFVCAIAGAYFAILIRCVYRIAEMAGGWGNYIMQDEPSFLVLDSSLIFVTTYLLTIFHPGFYFPQMCKGSKAPTPADVETPETRAASESPDSSNEGQKTEKEH